MNIPQITLIVPQDALQLYTSIFQYGVVYQAKADCQLIDFLTNIPKIDYHFLQKKVETILLDGLPIDSLATSFHQKNHTVALSAAMPGLAGAILRRNSIHAALRTSKPSMKKSESNYAITTITLKLFNNIAQELGAKLLHNGITINNNVWIKFFSTRAHLQDRIEEIMCDGKPLSYSQCLTRVKEHPQISLLFRGNNE